MDVKLVEDFFARLKRQDKINYQESFIKNVSIFHIEFTLK